MPTKIKLETLQDLNDKYQRRLIRAKNDLKALNALLIRLDEKTPNKPLTLIDELLKGTSTLDFSRYKDLYQSLGLLSGAILKLSRRNTQIRHLHPESDWPALTSFVSFFRGLTEKGTKLSQAQLQGLRDDLRLFRSDIEKYKSESEQLVGDLETASKTLQSSIKVIEFVKSIKHDLKKLDGMLLQTNFEVEHDYFEKTLKPLMAETTKNAKAALQDVEDYKKQIKTKKSSTASTSDPIVDFTDEIALQVISLPQNALQSLESKLITDFKNFNKYEIRKTITQAITEAEAFEELSIKSSTPKEPAPEARSSTPRYQNISSLLDDHPAKFITKLVSSEHSSYVSETTSAAWPLYKRAAALRLSLLLGEATKLLNIYQNNPANADYYKALTNLRNDVAHLYSSTDGSALLYRLLHSTDSSVIKIFARLDTILADAVTYLGNTSTASPVPQAQSIIDFHDDFLRTKVTGIPTDDLFDDRIQALNTYAKVSARLDEKDTSSTMRLAREFLLIGAGECAKSLETNSKVRTCATQDHFKWIEELIDFRNGLAHDLYELGRSYHSEVSLRLKKLVSMQDTNDTLRATLRALYCIEEFASRTHDVGHEFERLLLDMKEAPGDVASKKAKKRARAKKVFAPRFKELLLQLVRSLSSRHGVPEKELGPKLAGIMQKLFSQKNVPVTVNAPNNKEPARNEQFDSPSKHKSFSTPERKAIRQLVNSPQKCLVPGYYQEQYDALVVRCQTALTNIDTALAAKGLPPGDILNTLQSLRDDIYHFLTDGLDRIQLGELRSFQSRVNQSITVPSRGKTTFANDKAKTAMRETLSDETRQLCKSEWGTSPVAAGKLAITPDHPKPAPTKSRRNVKAIPFCLSESDSDSDNDTEKDEKDHKTTKTRSLKPIPFWEAGRSADPDPDNKAKTDKTDHNKTNTDTLSSPKNCK